MDGGFVVLSVVTQADRCSDSLLFLWLMIPQMVVVVMTLDVQQLPMMHVDTNKNIKFGLNIVALTTSFMVLAHTAENTYTDKYSAAMQTCRQTLSTM